MIIYLGTFYYLCLAVIQATDSRLNVDIDELDSKLMAQNNQIDSEPDKSNAKMKLQNSVKSASGNCKVSLESNAKSEIAQPPSVRMIKFNREESKEEVQKTSLGQKEWGTEVKDLVPRKSEKIETYTETYTVTQLKTRVLTRKHKFIQRRRQIKQRINKPVLITRRKLIKERQTFERIIPKVIETKEIMNRPEVKIKIVTGPVEEVTDEPPTEPGIDVYETSTEDCVEETKIEGVTTGVNSGAINTVVVGGNEESIASVVVQDASQDVGQPTVPEDIAQEVVVPDRGIGEILVSNKQKEIETAEAQANAAAEEAVDLEKIRPHQRTFIHPNYRVSVHQGHQPQQEVQQKSYAQQVYSFPDAVAYPQPYYNYPYNPYSSYGLQVYEAY